MDNRKQRLRELEISRQMYEMSALYCASWVADEAFHPL
jgi:hypothetical protein